MLKWIGLLAMLIDHIAFYFFDKIPHLLYELMRGFGRLAMPIFAFSLAFGFLKSRNWLKYFIRLLFLALLSEFVIRKTYQMIGFYRSGTNILFTFSFSLVFMIALNILVNSGYDLLVRMQPIGSTGLGQDELPYQFRVNLGGVELPPSVGLVLGLFFMIVSGICIVYFDTEYGLYGLLIISAFYLILSFQIKRKLLWAYILIIAINLFFQIAELINLGDAFSFNSLQWITVFAVPLCFQEEEPKKPQKWQKYFFYLFYPVHLAIFGLLRFFLLT
ncbi:MAG TPA: TraX family protein [Candidatus Eisenbacteria bacterium]|nr:TraX family protein [Candidatus Eisenbacteria bacterium]